MDEVLSFLKARGWRVLSVEPNLVTLHIDPIEVVRASCRLRNSLADIGVHIYPFKQPFDRPAAWAEYDCSSMRAKIYFVINDEWMPRGRAAKEKEANARRLADRVEPIEP